jgi:ABC-type uncharacterized transport system involved in gliding motility auxiliary subunit
VVVLAALVGVNVLASRTNVAWDLTRGGLNTLAPQSVLAAKRLTADLQVIGLFRPGSLSHQTESEALIRLYQAESSRVKYRSANVDTDVADVNRYKVKEPNTIVLDYGGKTQLLAQGSQDEVGFTAALIKLESDRVPVVCWATGDGERSLTDNNNSSGYTSVADILARNSFTTRDLLLSQAASVPADCDEVAVVTPTSALPDRSVKALTDYLAGGGKLLVAGEPWPQQPAALQSLNAVLTPYGLAFSGALVVEADPSRASSQDPTIPAVIDYGRSPITGPIQRHVSFFPRTTVITGSPESSSTVVAIARTSSSSYAVESARSDPQKRQGADKGGPFTIMATLEKAAGQKKTRIVIVGTAAFAENRTLPPNNDDANIELALGSFQWLAEQDALISIPPKAGRSLPLALTQQDQSTIIFITTALMPGLIVFGGVMVWWRRRVFS